MLETAKHTQRQPDIGNVGDSLTSLQPFPKNYDFPRISLKKQSAHK